MKRKRPTLAYVLIAVASLIFSTEQPPHNLVPENNAVALADGVGQLIP
jgi:hypothetical protein